MYECHVFTARLELMISRLGRHNQCSNRPTGSDPVCLCNPESRVSLHCPERHPSKPKTFFCQVVRLNRRSCHVPRFRHRKASIHSGYIRPFQVFRPYWSPSRLRIHLHRDKLYVGRSVGRCGMRRVHQDTTFIIIIMLERPRTK